GDFTPERESTHLKLMGVNTRPENVTAGGEEADWDYDETDGGIAIRLRESAEQITVEVRM
ncbi:MAG: hypothetical protein M3475_07430, partial [Actinomycetota bacterium]|nr:hypothetical protein [Actinomycetota bacterium]